jgi:multidrug efflux pump subunit AcrA (membrane-fusion protein)
MRAPRDTDTTRLLTGPSMTPALPAFPAPRDQSRARVLLGALVLSLSACAGVPVPTEQMNASNAALARAVSAGSPELAPAETTAARDKMNRGQSAIDAKDNERALQLAQQAEVDAQLAEARAGAVKARRASEAMLESNRVLRDEMNRNAPTSPLPRT